MSDDPSTATASVPNEASDKPKETLSTAQAAIQRVTELARLIPKELSGKEKAILLIPIIAAVMALGAGVYFALAKNTLHLLILFLAPVVLLGMAIMYFTGVIQVRRDEVITEHQKARSEENKIRQDKIEEEHLKLAQELLQKGRIAWSREVIELPLADDDRKARIIAELADIRTGALWWLREKKADIQEWQVRSNIFLPEYREAGNGVVCMLRMPEFFRLGMVGHADEEITFRPGEGATGKAFVENKEDVVIRKSQRWDDRYLLSEYQKRKIHEELSWIITYPLKNKDGRAVAVLNVDCLGLTIEEDALYHLKDDLRPKVNTIESILAEYPDKVKVSIAVETMRQAT